MNDHPATRGTAAVIGGGFAGLATAALMAREGYSVTLLEARDELGGRAGEWTSEGFRFETGPSWFLMPEVFEHFFDLLGTSLDQELELKRLDPGYRVLFENHAEAFDLPAENSAAALERIGADPERLKHYLESAAETYRLATEKLLYSTYSSPRSFLEPALLRRLPTLLKMLAQPLEKFIADHAPDHRLRQVLGYPAVFLGTSPRDAPSLYHLMSHLDINQGVLYPRGGFSAVVSAVANAARKEGVLIRTGCRAQHITGSRGRTTGVHFTDDEGKLQFLKTDTVVSTADMHLTETTLLSKGHRSMPKRTWTTRDPGPSAVLALLGVRGELPQLAHHTLLFTEDWQRGFDEISGLRVQSGAPRSVYVCRPSASDDVAPGGHENLFVLIPVHADPSLGSGGIDRSGDPQVEKIVDETIAQIADWAAVPDFAQRVTVRRSIGPADFQEMYGAWRGGALGPAHTLRQSAFFRGPTASRKLKGLFYAGATTMPGIGVPMCLISAELVIKALRKDHTAGPVEVLGAD